MAVQTLPRDPPGEGAKIKIKNRRKHSQVLVVSDRGSDWGRNPDLKHPERSYEEDVGRDGTEHNEFEEARVQQFLDKLSSH